MKKKILLTVCALALVVALSIAGTVAWLTDKTDAVENTFTVGKVDISLVETFNTDTNSDGTNDAWAAQLIPGKSYTKDPVVTVAGDSEDCYLFIKFEQVGNPATYLVYTSNLTAANGWTALTGVSDVWYRVVNKADAVKSFALLEGNTIKVSETGVTMTTMNAAKDAKLVYTAYAVQAAGSTDAAVAWGKIA